MTNREKLGSYKVEIMNLPEEDGGGYQALYPQLSRSVVGYGETQAEALEDLLGAADLFLASLDEDQIALPASEPRADWQDFSGRITVRVSKSLHHRLDRLKDAEGVSLNSLISDMLQSGATALEAGMTFGAVDASRTSLHNAWRDPGLARQLVVHEGMGEAQSGSSLRRSDLFTSLTHDSLEGYEFRRFAS